MVLRPRYLPPGFTSASTASCTQTRPKATPDADGPAMRAKAVSSCRRNVVLTIQPEPDLSLTILSSLPCSKGGDGYLKTDKTPLWPNVPLRPAASSHRGRLPQPAPTGSTIDDATAWLPEEGKPRQSGGPNYEAPAGSSNDTLKPWGAGGGASRPGKRQKIGRQLDQSQQPDDGDAAQPAKQSEAAAKDCLRRVPLHHEGGSRPPPALPRSRATQPLPPILRGREDQAAVRRPAAPSEQPTAAASSAPDVHLHTLRLFPIYPCTSINCREPQVWIMFKHPIIKMPSPAPQFPHRVILDSSATHLMFQYSHSPLHSPHPSIGHKWSIWGLRYPGGCVLPRH